LMFLDGHLGWDRLTCQSRAFLPFSHKGRRKKAAS
jgi:hypothetical protein